MSRSQLFGVLIVIVSCSLVLGSLYYVYQKKETSRVEALPFMQIMEAGDGTYTDLTGVTRSLGEYRGKRVVMMSWASWCPQCAEQLALVAQAATETQSTLPILAMNRKESREAAQLYLGVVGRHDRLTYILDTEDHAFRVSEGYAMPEFVVYSEDGSELFHARGTLTQSELRTLFETYK